MNFKGLKKCSEYDKIINVVYSQTYLIMNIYTAKVAILLLDFYRNDKYEFNKNRRKGIQFRAFDL